MPSVQIYPHPIFNENDLNPRPSPRNNTTTSTNNNNNNVSPTVNNNTIQEETKIDIDDDNLPLAVTINDAGILGILNGRMSCSHPYELMVHGFGPRQVAVLACWQKRVPFALPFHN